MDSSKQQSGFHTITARAFTALAVLCVAAVATVSAQPPPAVPSATAGTDYVIGPQDVLTITSYDQADLSGKFAVETDGTFAYPMIGRVKAGGFTLRDVELHVKKQLKDGGYFNNPQITVAIETYKSQKIFVVGEVRSPGAVTLTGDMSLVEALARAGSTLPSAGGEAVIVHPSRPGATGPELPNQAEGSNVVRINLRELEDGVLSKNAMLRDGDTIFVPRAESIYVYGHVRNPNAYAMQHKQTTVLQALSLAGGMTDRGSTNRIKIVRIVNGEKKELKAKLGDIVLPGDTIIVNERFF